MVNYIEGNRTISLGRGEIPITPVTPSCAERCYPASNFLLGHFRVFGIFFGILFTKNALQNVLQGISAERTRFELVIRLPVCRFSKPVDSATLPPLQSTLRLVSKLVGFSVSGRQSYNNFLVFQYFCGGSVFWQG